MKKQQETEAELLEQIRANIRPIRDGDAPFYDEPDDIGWHLRDNAIHNIEAGQAYITEVTLPYLEEEAIARLRKRTNIAPLVEPDKYKEPEYWRQKWVNEALCVEPHLYGYDAISQAAIRVLLTASRLRSAIEENNPQMIAALSMLLGCEVFEGGYSLRFEAIKAAKEAIEKTRADIYKKSIGAEAEDHERARQACIQAADKMWKADPTRRIGDVAKELNSRLLDKLDKLPALDLTPAPDTIKGWLKAAARDGKLIIPEAAQRRGRPPKAAK